MSAPRRHFLLGATATGKTAVALELAPLLNAEILSLDSMLVYRGMDVGTAKPTAAERARVPHHLLDLVEPSTAFSVAQWLDAALAAERELAARGRAALYVGGTALYLKALLHGLPAGVTPPPAVRQAVREEWQAPGGPLRLRAELERVDAAAAARIHPRDGQRTQRALEHWRAFGTRWSEVLAPWPPGRALGVQAAALHWPRALLHERIEQRFTAMLQEGLLEEVRRLRDGPGFGPTAGGAVGYRRLLEHLAGRCALAEAVRCAVRDTRVLVRRQETWLRSFPDLTWIAAAHRTATELAAEIHATWAARD